MLTVVRTACSVGGTVFGDVTVQLQFAGRPAKPNDPDASRDICCLERSDELIETTGEGALSGGRNCNVAGNEGVAPVV